MSPDRQTLIDLAAALNTDPAFLEKDFYVCQVIKTLAEFSHGRMEAIFCGGTSLLHGYKRISRFSEDIDFRIRSSGEEPTTREERRAYRDALIAFLDSIPDIHVNKAHIISRDESRFFGVMLSYPRQFEDHSALRPEVKLEGTFDKDVISSLEAKEIRPLIGDYVAVDCVSTIMCLSPLQTAADKLSALSWRVAVRQRGDDDPDFAVIRHLYDLHALASDIDRDFPEFVLMAERAYGVDRRRKGGMAPDQLLQATVMALDAFRMDKQYAQEYEQYVRAMCFGSMAPPAYDEAVDAFGMLVDKFTALPSR